MSMADKLLAQAEALKLEARNLIAGAELETRDLTPAEYERIKQINADRESVEDRAKTIKAAETAESRAGGLLGVVPGEPVVPNVRVKSEPMTYAKHAETSFFRDLAYGTIQNDPNAWGRLNRHRQEVAVETRAGSRTDTTSIGDLVPPVSLIADFAALARASRTTANLVRSMPLPSGTDSINIPVVTTGTLTGVQTADNATATTQDMVTSTVAAPVRTIAGYFDTAIQTLEQSGLSAGLDSLIFADLTADYARALDVQVINGSGSSGQMKGILNATGITASTYTDASPTVPELYPIMAQAINAVVKNRYFAPDFAVMHPSTWYWALSALDSSNRPLVVPTDQGPYNTLGSDNSNLGPNGGPVGRILGLPVVLDPNVPVNLGAGTNQAPIIVGRFVDSYLFEGTVRTSVHTDVLSGSLGVRFRLYNYCAFTAERFPKAYAVVNGTGMIVQSGY